MYMMTAPRPTALQLVQQPDDMQHVLAVLAGHPDFRQFRSIHHAEHIQIDLFAPKDRAQVGESIVLQDADDQRTVQL